ncbi:MAG: hypothetical protein J5I65_09465 [Aridibacter famidurans]|nr:hypothetical protein [Aridibacter famidurans]
MRFSGLLVLVLFLQFVLFLPAVLAQQNSNVARVNTWRQRVESLTDEIVADSGSVEASEQTIYLALSAQMWSSVDNEVSAGLIGKVSKSASGSIDEGNDPKLETKIKNLQETIEILAKIDSVKSRQLVEDLIKLIAGKAEDQTAESETLIAIAIQIVARDPQRAYELGIASLSVGIAPGFSSLVGELNLVNESLANSLFSASLNLIRNSFDLQDAATLQTRAFLPYKGKSLSLDSRRQYLTTLSEILAQAFLDPLRRQSACQFALLASGVLDAFQQILPGRLPTIRQQIGLCQSSIPSNLAGSVEPRISDEKLETVDELVQAARATKDALLKAKYFYQAIVILEKEKKFEKILSLLDEMTEQERKSLGNGAWDSWRADYAYRGALNSIEAEDIPSAYRIVEKTPKKLRPFVRLNLADELEYSNYKSLVFENIEAAQAEIKDLGISTSERVEFSLSVLRLYARSRPDETMKVFWDLVKEVNEAGRENRNGEMEKEFLANLNYIPLPALLLDIDDIGTLASLNDVSSRRNRVRLKLGLLETSLREYSIALKDLNKSLEDETNN